MKRREQMNYELGYTNSDDGVWITCKNHYHYGKNLGHFATVDDAIKAREELGKCPYCEGESK